MVDQCWCDEIGPEGAILSVGDTSIENEQQAMDAVKKNVDDEGVDVKRAAKLNEIFYNVFTEDSSGDEKVYTVAVDGTIILTQCGV